ncbi:MAG: hypothetical protein AAGK01_03015 [Pseudomonadota bacterium]
MLDFQPIFSLGLTDLGQSYSDAKPQAGVPDVPALKPPLASLSISLPEGMEARLN